MIAGTASGANASREAPARGDLPGRTLHANPGDYLERLRTLEPGDTLVLAPGDYDPPGAPPGLPLFELHGTPSAPITITGPSSGPRPRLLGRVGYNTVRLANTSHLVVANLDIDSRNLGGDGVNAQGIAHHITLRNLDIRGVGAAQGVVGISANRAPTWNWIIRDNRITGAGTGMYLGNSDGGNPFVAGVIEGNVVRDTIGYNVQIKHQVPWPTGKGLPVEPTKTIIRRNTFVKGAGSSRGSMARPNLLVGDVPREGPGSSNAYEIYGNRFLGNPSEALLQAEGNVAIYSNEFVNHDGPAITVQRHHGVVREVRIFGNTIVAAGHGILVRDGDPSFEQRVVANAVFANPPIAASHASSNVVAPYMRAEHYLDLARTDVALMPRSGRLEGPRVDGHLFERFTDGNRDFNGSLRNWRWRGAHSPPAATPPARASK